MKATSFVIVDKQTGKAVMETFNRATADAVNRNKFDVLPTLEYLQKLNRDLSMERKSNPTKKFSPAQIAAQKLFAERARAGTLGKGKRKAVVKRRANPEPYNPYASRNMLEEYAGKTDAQLRYIIKDAGAAAVAQRGMQSEMKYLDQVNDANTVLYRRSKGLNEVTGSKVGKMKIERSETPDNPEGIVVTEAGALRFAKQNMPNDLKKAGFVASIFPGARGWVINYGKAVKRNPDKEKPNVYIKRVSQATGAPPTKRLVKRRTKALFAPAGYFPNPKVKYTNRAKDLKGEQRVGYSVHRADAPSYLAIAWFSKKSDAVQVAQEASDRTGKQLAVTRVQNYFGSM